LAEQSACSFGRGGRGRSDGAAFWFDRDTHGDRAGGYEVSGTRPGVGDSLAVEKGAVGAVEVFEEDAVGRGLERAVGSGEKVVFRKWDRNGGIASDDKRVVVERMLRSGARANDDFEEELH
jgi:hypothetical protein